MWTPGKPSIPPRIETNQQFARTAPDCQRALGKPRRRWGRPYSRATPSLRCAPTGVLILIVADLSSCLSPGTLPRQGVGKLAQRRADRGRSRFPTRRSTRAALVRSAVRRSRVLDRSRPDGRRRVRPHWVFGSQPPRWLRDECDPRRRLDIQDQAANRTRFRRHALALRPRRGALPRQRCRRTSLDAGTAFRLRRQSDRDLLMNICS